MRILYCIASFSGKGGTEKVLSSKAAALSARGHEVFILISDQHGKPFAYPLPPEVKVKDMKITTLLHRRIKGFDFIRNIFILRKIYGVETSEIKPDVIIVLERGYEDFVIPYIHRNIPKVREYHTSRKASVFFESAMAPIQRIKSKIIRLFYEAQYKKYDSFVILTEKDALNWNHFSHISIIPNMVEQQDGQAVPLLQRPKRLIAVGSMVADRKGFAEMIEIWKGMANDYPDWTLHIYGDGPYRSQYTKLIKQLKLEKKVFLEGISSNIFQEYGQAQVFLMTSKGEGFGMVIIEAQQSGLPVIVYDCFSGPSDILKKDRGGYLIPMQDKTQFAQKLGNILTDAELREKKGQEAYENSQRYLPSEIIPHWEHLFYSLTKK